MNIQVSRPSQHVVVVTNCERIQRSLAEHLGVGAALRRTDDVVDFIKNEITKEYTRPVFAVLRRDSGVSFADAYGRAQNLIPADRVLPIDSTISSSQMVAAVRRRLAQIAAENPIEVVAEPSEDDLSEPVEKPVSAPTTPWPAAAPTTDLSAEENFEEAPESSDDDSFDAFGPASEPAEAAIADKACGEPDNAAVTFTVINALRPSVLSKRFTLSADGTLEKHPGGQLAEGRARKVELRSAAEFASLLASLSPSQAIVHGVFEHDEAIVLSKKRLDKRRGQNSVLPIVTRTKGDVKWPTGPGALMCDYDPPDGAEPMSSEEVREALYSVLPELRTAPHVCRPSASSCIYRKSDGAELRGVRGQRVYIFVQNARDIERAAKVMQDRLWLDGRGYFVVSKAGSLLERTLIDGAVFQPERLDFAGGAQCGDGLEQRLPEPEVFNSGAPWLDTARALPNLNGDEHLRVEQIKAAARIAKEPEAKAAREAWINERVGLFAATLDEQDESKRDQRISNYEASCRAAVEDGRLYGDFEITPDDDTTVTVGEVLDDPNKYQGRKVYHPVEGVNYDNGRICSQINLRSSRPYIWSFAHGGQRFHLIRARKKIALGVGERADTFAKTMELIRLDSTLFERGGALTRIVGNRTEPVTSEWLLLHLDRTVRFESYKLNKEGEIVAVPHDAPEWLTRRTVKANGEWALPEIRGVVHSATIDPASGRIIAEEGFDAASGLFVHISNDAPTVPENVGADDAKEALATLWKPFERFPFSDARDGSISRGVFLAALLTAVCRRLLHTAPGFLIDAPVAGSGKTLLALCAAAIASDDHPSVLGVAEGISEEEVKKALFAEALNASPVMLIDNVAGMFKSAAICAFLTSPNYRDRVLGVSRTANVPTNSLFLMTGNHPIIVGDLNRRLLRCELDPQMELPHKRAFKLDPLDYCREHRHEMTRAALALLKVWHNAGRPRLTEDRTASFEMWSDSVRQVVIWVGRNGWLDVVDPIASLDIGFAGDPETCKLDGLLQAWTAWDAKLREQGRGKDHYQVSDLSIEAQRGHGELFDAIDEIGVIERGVLNRRRLGCWIEQRAGRVVNGRCFVRVGKTSGALTWRVSEVATAK